MLLEAAAGALFALGSTLLIGRVIGPDAVGQAAIAIAAFLLLDIVGSWLFTDALARAPVLETRHAETAFFVAGGIGCGAALILYLGAPHLATGSAVPDIQALCLALAPLLPISAVAGAAAGVAQRQGRLSLLALRTLVGQPLALAGGLLLAEAGAGPWAVIGYQLGATVSAFLLVVGLGRLAVRPRLDRDALREMLPVALPQVLAVLVGAGRYRLFLLLLAFVTTEAAIGVCHLAIRMLEAVLSLAWQSGSRIAMTRLYLQAGHPGRLAESYGDLAQLLALIGLPMAVGIALTAPDLVRAALGPDWAAAGDVARIVGMSAAFTFLQGDYATLFVALGKARRNPVLSMVFMALPLLALAIARPASPAGVALCWATGSVAMPMVALPLVLRDLDRSALWLLRRLMPALVATAGMTAAVIGVQGLDEGPAAQRLFVSVVIGAVAYLSLAWIGLGRTMPAAMQPAEDRRSSALV